MIRLRDLFAWWPKPRRRHFGDLELFNGGRRSPASARFYRREDELWLELKGLPICDCIAIAVADPYLPLIVEAAVLFQEEERRRANPS